MQIPMSEMVPEVPPALKYVEFRLPGTFREMVANSKFTNEEIGRIVRCIALDTDVFMTQKIEPEVFYYRSKLIERSALRKRVADHRERKRVMASAGGLSASMNVTVTQNDAVTVTKAESSDSRLSSIEKTPSQPKEKTPPIIPLKEKPLPSLEKKTSRTKKRTADDELSEDLFSLAAGVNKAIVPEMSQKMAQKHAQDRPAESEGGDMVQDIETSPMAVLGPEKDMSGSDSRQDMAWIPGRFEIFWKEYPRKVAKGAANKAFMKLIKEQRNPEEFMKTMMSSLRWWKVQQDWIKDNGKFIPYPATWLNRGSWADSRDNSSAISSGRAEFLASDEESEADLIRRMSGG